MALYLGKKKITPIKVVDLEDDLNTELTEQEEKLELVGVKVNDLPIHEPITDDLKEQANMVADIESQVNSLKDISNETLNINENGEYNVVDYGKVVVNVGGKVVEINLPEEFANATSIYNFQVDSDTLLVSNNIDNTGLWVYKISTNTLEQKYSNGSNWSTFRIVQDGCLIGGSSGNSTGVLLYNSLNNSVTQLYDKYHTWVRFNQVSETKVLISGRSNGSASGKGVLLYDFNSKSIVELYADGQYWEFFKVINNKCLIISGDGSYTRMLIYNILDDTIIIKNNITYDLTNYQQVTETKWLMSSTATSGVWLYNYSDDTMDKIYSSASNWKTFQMIEDCCLVCGGTGTDSGVLLYNLVDDTISKVYASGNWTSITKVGENKYIISAGSSNTGLLLYDFSNNTFTQIYAEGYHWIYIQQVTETKWLFASGSSGTASAGILVYNSTDDSVNKIYTSGYQWANFQVVGENCLISSFSSASTGILVYASADDTITKPYTSGYNVKTFLLVGNNCLIILGSTILLYKYSTNTIVKLFNPSSGSAYDTFTRDGENYYIESSDKSTFGWKLYYDSAEEKIQAVGYYMGVQ